MFYATFIENVIDNQLDDLSNIDFWLDEYLDEVNEATFDIYNKSFSLSNTVGIKNYVRASYYNFGYWDIINKKESAYDFKPYEKDIENGMPRQLARAKHNYLPDAWEQLDEAFIFVFHYKYAWGVFKYQLECLVTLKCSLCKHRHIKPIKINNVKCYYGWWYMLKHFIPGIWWAGKHGDD